MNPSIPSHVVSPRTVDIGSSDPRDWWVEDRLSVTEFGSCMYVVILFSLSSSSGNPVKANHFKNPNAMIFPK